MKHKTLEYMQGSRQQRGYTKRQLNAWLHYSARFFPATPDRGYQSRDAYRLCLWIVLGAQGVPVGCAWRTCPRDDWSTGVPTDLACGLCLPAGGDWSRGVLAECDWSTGVVPTKHQNNPSVYGCMCMCICVYGCMGVCVYVWTRHLCRRTTKTPTQSRQPVVQFYKTLYIPPKWNRGKPPFARWDCAPKRPLRSTSCKRTPTRAIWFRTSRTLHTFGATLGEHTWPRFPVSHHSSTTSMSTVAWRRRIQSGLEGVFPAQQGRTERRLARCPRSLSLPGRSGPQRSTSGSTCPLPTLSQPIRAHGSRSQSRASKRRTRVGSPKPGQPSTGARGRQPDLLPSWTCRSCLSKLCRPACPSSSDNLWQTAWHCTKSTTHRTSRAPWIGRCWSDTWRRRTASATKASPPKRTCRAVFWTTPAPLATTFALVYGVQANERYRPSSTTRWCRKSRRATCGASLEAICRVSWPAPTSIFGELWPTRTFWRVAVQGWRFPSTAALWKSWMQEKQAPCSRTLCAWRPRKERGQIQAYSWCSP